MGSQLSVWKVSKMIKLNTHKEVGVSFLREGCDNSRKETGHFCKINRAAGFRKADRLTLDCWKLKRVKGDGKVQTSANYTSICQYLPCLRVINQNRWIVLIQVYSLSDVFWQEIWCREIKGTKPRAGYGSHTDLIESSICLVRLVTLSWSPFSDKY